MIWYPQPEFWSLCSCLSPTLSQRPEPQLLDTSTPLNGLLSLTGVQSRTKSCHLATCRPSYPFYKSCGIRGSMLKVYLGIITVNHALMAGQSVGANDLVVKFLRGGKRLNPPCPHTVPTWDPSTVFRALQ